ncbi:hypothetical protein [Butyrivibrio sp. MB2005]|uniref:hypothetical protein n=1 Tax=Butyrivibrio sp. MB2005 TaxID=1280678 RepID=UPI00040988F0|nr:hypothetical protein [Butyrivibrio sp. MB2005]
MKMPFFTSFILLVLITQIAIRRTSYKIESKEADFWEKERKANFTRRKPLDNLNYIKIPIEALPFGALDDDESRYCEKVIKSLADQKVVNLTGFTNTDLKLEYGAPNITELTRYDQNYTTLVTNLQKWGKLLYDAKLYKEATTVLEFATDTGTDVTGTYKLLTDLYQNKLELSDSEKKEKISALLPVAEELRSLSKDQIKRLLTESL